MFKKIKPFKVIVLSLTLLALSGCAKEGPLSGSFIFSNDYAYGSNGHILKLSRQPGERIYNLMFRYDFPDIQKRYTCDPGEGPLCLSYGDNVAGGVKQIPEIIYFSWVTEQGVQRIEHIPFKKMITSQYTKKQLMNFQVEFYLTGSEIKVVLVLDTTRVTAMQLTGDVEKDRKLIEKRIKEDNLKNPNYTAQTRITIYQSTTNTY